MNLKIQGTEIDLNLDELRADRVKGLERCAALLAQATSEELEAQAYYRHWRAVTGQQIEASRKKSAPALAEWKIKQKIEAQETFRSLKNGLAAARANVVYLETLVEGLKADDED